MTIPNFTDEQKIAKFDEIQEEAIAIDNWSEEDGELDEHYFVEAVVNIALGR